jgi:outer membrane lipoprotein-sorting protein
MVVASLYIKRYRAYINLKQGWKGRNMKRIVVLLAAIMLAALFLSSGCGKKSDSGATSTTSVTQNSRQSNSDNANSSNDSDQNQDQGTSSSSDWDGKITSLLAKAKTIEGMECDYYLDGEKFKTQGKVWMKDTNLVRTEVPMAGRMVVMITDGPGKAVYMFEKDGKTATKVPVNQNSKDEEQRSPIDYVNMIDPKTVESIEETELDGMPVVYVVYKYKNKSDQSVPMKIWLRKDNGLPVKVESTGTNDITFVMTYKNLKIGPVSEDLFKVPDGMKIETLDPASMMKNMPKNPGAMSKGMPQP